MLQFPARTRYDKGEEFAYGYSIKVDPLHLMYSYGMFFENNPYSVINNNENVLFKRFNSIQKEMCLLIGCVDPVNYPEVET